MTTTITNIKDRVSTSYRKFSSIKVLPFVEKPSNARQSSKQDGVDGKELGAFDLFSMFTADIIRKNVPFTR